MVKWCQITKEETCCHHMGYTFQLATRVLLYASSHRQDNRYHWLEQEIAQWVHHEGSIRHSLTMELHLAPGSTMKDRSDTLIPRRYISLRIGLQMTHLHGWTDAIGGPGRCGCASIVTVFFAWSWLKSAYISSTVNGFRFCITINEKKK